MPPCKSLIFLFLLFVSKLLIFYLNGSLSEAEKYLGPLGFHYKRVLPYSELKKMYLMHKQTAVVMLQRKTFYRL
jgi:hypothetical protein